MYKLDLEKTEEPAIKFPTSIGSQKKTREFQKTFTSASLTMVKPLTVDHNKFWNNFKEMEYQTTLPASWETCMQIKKQQLEPDME